MVQSIVCTIWGPICLWWVPGCAQCLLNEPHASWASLYLSKAWELGHRCGRTLMSQNSASQVVPVLRVAGASRPCSNSFPGRFLRHLLGIPKPEQMFPSWSCNRDQVLREDLEATSAVPLTARPRLKPYRWMRRYLSFRFRLLRGGSTVPNGPSPLISLFLSYNLKPLCTFFLSHSFFKVFLWFMYAQIREFASMILPCSGINNHKRSCYLLNTHWVPVTVLNTWKALCHLLIFFHLKGALWVSIISSLYQ